MSVFPTSVSENIGVFREKLQSSSLLIGAKTFEQWEHRNGAEGSVRQ